MTRRRPSQAAEEEFRALRVFFEVGFEFMIVRSMPASVDVDALVPTFPDSLAEASNLTPSQILVGLRQAASDIVEFSRHLPESERQLLEDRLEERGAASVEVMRSSDWKAVLAVLRRGKIKTESEYYLLQERVSCLDDGLLSETQREIASRILGAYEL